MSDSYPPISDYGYIGDCHSAALISSRGFHRLVLHAEA